MKRLLKMLAVAAAVMAVACKPSIYTGPLDAPSGNWLGVHTEYRFAGEEVASADSCEYGVISFYRQGLCCIEGHKGALPYVYDADMSVLEIGTRIWRVNVLTGAEMILEFVEDTAGTDESQGGDGGEAGNASWDSAADDGELPDGGVFPVEYRGFTIVSEEGRYFYVDKNGQKVRCYYEGEKDQDGKLYVKFWYDTHIDRFVPYS